MADLNDITDLELQVHPTTPPATLPTMLPLVPPALTVTAASTSMPPDPTMAIRIRGLAKRYGAVQALGGLNLDIPRGSLYGIIGPNGAGKTTMLSVVATLLIPTSGTVDVLGHNPVSNPKAVRKVMGYMPDVMGVNERLTVDEYLRFFAHSYKLNKRTWDTTIENLLELVNLADKRSEIVDSLSRGMKQRLSLARSLIHEPELLILDEPASGLDPQARVELRMLLQELQRMGKTIVISSHILAELQEMCTHVAIIANGNLAAAGSTEELSKRRSGIRIKIRLADGRESETTVTDAAAQQALLHDLMVVQGLAVIEFRSVTEGLEELFMQAIANSPTHPQTPAFGPGSSGHMGFPQPGYAQPVYPQPVGPSGPSGYWQPPGQAPQYLPPPPPAAAPAPPASS